MKHELVQNWMTSDVITADVCLTVPEAHHLLKTNQIRRLPVTKEGRLVGIVTLGDVREANPSTATTLSMWELNYLLSRLTLEKIMTRNVITVRPDETIGTAAHKMLENRISGLPVVNHNGTLVGMITESDIFSMVVLDEWRMEYEQAAVP